MQVTTEVTSLYAFEAWRGAVYTKKKLMENGIDEDFISFAEDLFPEGCTDTELNDLLWFESDTIFEHFGLDENGDPLENTDDEGAED